MTTYKKGVPTQLSEHFSSTEFDCHCKRQECDTTQIDPDLIRKLDAFRESVGLPLVIDSGYRCAGKQADLRAQGYETAAGPSTHERGQAADVAVKGLTGAVLQEHAILAGFKAIGRANTWIHVDLRSDKVRRWSYSP